MSYTLTPPLGAHQQAVLDIILTSVETGIEISMTDTLSVTVAADEVKAG
jgi:hypothetical protein